MRLKLHLIRFLVNTVKKVIQAVLFVDDNNKIISVPLKLGRV